MTKLSELDFASSQSAVMNLGGCYFIEEPESFWTYPSSALQPYSVPNGAELPRSPPSFSTSIISQTPFPSPLSTQNSPLTIYPHIPSVSSSTSLLCSAQNFSSIESSYRSLHQNAPKQPTPRPMEDFSPTCGITAPLPPFSSQEYRHLHGR